MPQQELKEAYALCPLCVQLSIWYTVDGELPPSHVQIACKRCGAPLDREQHKLRPLERPKWAQG